MTSVRGDGQSGMCHAGGVRQEEGDRDEEGGQGHRLDGKRTVEERDDRQVREHHGQGQGR